MRAKQIYVKASHKTSYQSIEIHGIILNGYEQDDFSRKETTYSDPSKWNSFLNLPLK